MGIAASTGLTAAAQTAAAPVRPDVQVRPEFRTAARSLVTQNIDRSRLVTVPGAVHREARAAQDLGLRDPFVPVEHMQLFLRRPAERQAALDALVDALHQPGNSSYHQWLTPEEVGSEFGPSQADLLALTNYLQGEGFTVNRVARSGMYVDFTGTVTQVQQSFHTEIHNLRLASGEQHYSAVRDAQLPQALAPLVVGFVSLSDIPAHPMVRHVQPTAAGSRPGPYRDASPDNTNGGSYDVGVQDFYTIYNETPLINAGNAGLGQTVAVLEETEIVAADVTTFRTAMNVVPNSPALTVLFGVHGYCNDPGITSTDEESEAVLDAEWASSVAPYATVIFTACQTVATNGIFLSAGYIIDNNLAASMSLSYGYSEVGQTSVDQYVSGLWEQAAAQGETVVVSSGDAGSANGADQDQPYASDGLAVNGFASGNYDVAAGGTDFQDSYNQGNSDSAFGIAKYWATTNSAGESSALSYVAETVWNNTCANSILDFDHTGSSDPNALCDESNYLPTTGGGGGVSIQWPRATWQNGTVYGIPPTSTYNFRLLPDVSLFAANGLWSHALDYYQSDGGGWQRAGGTSFVAPQLAGVFALVAQQTGQRVGQPNYVLYNMAGVEYGTSSYIAGSTCNGSGGIGTGVTTTAPATGNSCIFYDTETGNNSQACLAGTANCYTPSGKSYGILSTSTTSAIPAYPAGQGFDMATGLGSLNITNMVNNWQTGTPGGVPYTPTVIVSGPNPVSYGTTAAISYTTTVSGSGSFPTGTVIFADSPSVGTMGTDPLVASSTCSSGGPCAETATQTLTPSGPLALGSFTVTGTYSATNESYATGSGSLLVTVTQQTPTVTVSTPSPVTYGGAATVNLSATITYIGGGLAPTGGLTFKIGSGSTVTATCIGSSSPLTCTYTGYSTAGLTGGANTITATSLADTNYKSATGTGTLTINQQTPTVNVSSVAAITYGTATVDLSATVSYTGSGVAPSGGLTFKIGSGSTVSASCTGSSSPLTCTFTGYNTSSQAAGSHTITATSIADTNYKTATGTNTLTVNQQTPTVTASPVAIAYGANANLSASIAYTGGGSKPSGGLTFKVGSGSTVTATCTGSSSPLSCTYTGYPTSTLSPGTPTITAKAVADTNYATATGTNTLTITAQTPAVTVTPVSIAVGAATANLSATIAYTGGGVKPSGGLTFQVDSGAVVTASCTGLSSPLTCTYSGYGTASLASGSHTITANSIADTNYTVASGTGPLSVLPLPTITFSVASPHHTMDTSFTVSASSNSTGAITYSVVSGPATIAGNTVSLTGAAGTVVLQAVQAASASYSADTQNASFSVIAGSVWLANHTGSLSAVDLNLTAITGAGGLTGAGVGTPAGPLGLAFDASGNAWAASSNGVSEFSRQGVAIGSTATTSGGITNPVSVAVDGAGQVWVANSNGTVSVLNNAGVAVSPSGGYPGPGTQSAPTGIAVDISGSVWIPDHAGNTVTRLLGAAVPVVPLATGAATGQGVEP